MSDLETDLAREEAKDWSFIAGTYERRLTQAEAEIERLRAAPIKIVADLKPYGLHLPERIRYLAKVSRSNHDRGHHREAIVLDDHDWRWLEAVADFIHEHKVPERLGPSYDAAYKQNHKRRR